MSIPETIYDLVEHGQMVQADAVIGQVRKHAVRDFCEEVNRRAEANMIKTGKLEGSHYAAMQAIRKEMGV